MMDMFGAYSVGNFELRLLTYNVNVSPAEHDTIDETCIRCFTTHSDAWLQIDYGFHACSSYEDGTIQVGFQFLAHVS